MTDRAGLTQMHYSRKERIHLLITVAIMLLIFIHSAMPGDMSGAESNFIVRIIVSITGLPAEPLGIIVRKAAHFTEFMLLGMSIAVNVRDYLSRRSKTTVKQENWIKRLWATTWILGTLYAATDELHQLFVPDRACALKDVFIDSAGVAVGGGNDNNRVYYL